MAKISYTGCLGLSPAISVQFTLKMCVAAQNREKFTNTPYFGSSRSSMLTLLRSSSVLPPLPWGPLTQRHEILSRNTRDSRLSYSENPKTLSHLGLNQYGVVTDEHTDRQMDRITIANTRYNYASSHA